MEILNIFWFVYFAYTTIFMIGQFVAISFDFRKLGHAFLTSTIVAIFAIPLFLFWIPVFKLRNQNIEFDVFLEYICLEIFEKGFYGEKADHINQFAFRKDCVACEEDRSFLDHPFFEDIF